MSSVCLLTLCGLPAAGKTTFAQSFISFLKRESQNEQRCCTSMARTEYRLVHVLYDSMLPVVPKTDSVMSEWKSNRRAIYSCLKQLLARLLSKKRCESADRATDGAKDAESAGRATDGAKDAESAGSAIEGLENTKIVQFVSREFARLVHELDVEDRSGRPVVIILDDNMFYASMRYEVYQLARTYSTGYAQLYFTAKLARVIERNRDRSCPVPDAVIASMADRIDIPTSQNAWESNTIEWTDDDHVNQNYQKVVAIIDEALHNPVLPSVDESAIQESRVICSTNFIHQSDCILRHLVTEHITTMKAESTDGRLLRLRADRVNRVRQSILQDMRRHVLLVPQSVEDSVQVGQESGGTSTGSGSDRLLEFIRTVFAEYLLYAVDE